MKIKCKISDLQTIIRFVALKGKDSEGKENAAVEDCILTAAGGKLTVSIMDVQSTFGAKIDYKLIEVQEEGAMPISDIETFAKFLSRFNSDDPVTLSTVDNRIVIERESPKKIAKIPLASEESIASKPAPVFNNLLKDKNGYPQSPKNLWNLKLSLNASYVTSLFDDGDLIKQRILPWAVEGGKLKMSIVDEVMGSFETEVALDSIASNPDKVGPQKALVHFGRGVDNIFSNLSGSVTVYMIDNAQGPIVVEQSTEAFDFLAMIAPIVLGE